ncbi:MAG: MFS transporter, partial [Thaumarchaeota archaeon]|nr:MFS transporter [Nitrososphaerota archaeon]
MSSTIGSLSYAAGAYFLSLSKIANPAPGSQLIHGFASSPADLFALSALIEIVSIGILVMVIRKKEAPLQNVSSRDPGNAKVSSGGKVWNVLRTVLSFAVAEFSNGLGNGLFTQLAPLWFYLRFGISIAAVGQIFAGAGVITAFLILFSTRIEKRMGQTKPIFLMRAGYGALLFATALAPSLIAALILYYTSLILARIAAPIQQSLVFTRVQKEEWARGSSMIAISNLAGTSIGPLFGSFFLLNVNIPLPMM